ncbi:hypothetical protein MHYP_G00013630 [Metynnis hypsauchen]
MKDMEDKDERPTNQQKSKKATCTPKEASDQLIEGLKKELMAKQASLESNTEKEESSDEDLLPRNWNKAQQKIKELKRENKRLKEGNVKEILDAMRGHALSKFPDISVQDVRRIIRKKCNNESKPQQRRPCEKNFFSPFS